MQDINPKNPLMLLKPDRESRRISMKRRILLTLAVLILALAFGVRPALADDPPPCPISPCVYVVPDRDPAGNEDGSLVSPYNSANEGYAYARARSGGAYILSRNADGTWTTTFVAGATSGAGGLPFPKTTLYFLVAAVALSLIAAGWLLKRRSQQLRR
jgi:hypothetical protein